MGAWRHDFNGDGGSCFGSRVPVAVAAAFFRVGAAHSPHEQSTDLSAAETAQADGTPCRRILRPIKLRENLNQFVRYFFDLSSLQTKKPCGNR